MEIKNRFNDRVILSVKNDMTDSDFRGTDLHDADLSWYTMSGSDFREGDLRGANLYGADLSRANLSGANLSGANLQFAVLRGANLALADLRDANLSCAKFDYAHLSGANLKGTVINWYSRDLIAEILRSEAGNDIEKIKLAGFILISKNHCWPHFLAMDHPLKEWALQTLRGYVCKPDRAPYQIIPDILNPF